jgi:hypothetical protein
LRGFLRLPAHLRIRQRIEIRQINAQAAAHSSWSAPLTACGFEKDGSLLTLWPSAK